MDCWDSQDLTSVLINYKYWRGCWNLQIRHQSTIAIFLNSSAIEPHSSVVIGHLSSKRDFDGITDLMNDQGKKNYTLNKRHCGIK